MKITNENKSIMEILKNNNISLPFICAGRGTCGKCGIQIIKGDIPITEYDKKFYSKEELEDGYRLSCKAYPYKDVEIRLIDNIEKNVQIVSEYKNTTDLIVNNQFKEDGFGIIIDIGTTTIALALIDISNGNNVRTHTLINSQRLFGADVISRIESSINGNREALKQSIQRDILNGLKALSIDTPIQKIIIAANTTMIHLLMGFDCSGLGMSPFTPVTLEKLDLNFDEVFQSDLLSSTVTIMPSISAYIGGDITSGILMCGFDEKESISMLIDIGTNGEMVIGNKYNILCTSTAAGPALEGGNISSGVASIQGAISNVVIQQNKIQYKTIGDKPPIGICGSGVIDITAEALKNNLVDETGLLIDELFDNGIEISNKINFTQKDFREIQMAKSAICSGIETLIDNYGCKISEIENIYISGGFGYHINIDNAIVIGLIPEDFKSKIIVIGNSSLAGAEHYLLDNKSDERIEKILDISKEIYLANDINFNELYINNMYFK